MLPKAPRQGNSGVCTHWKMVAVAASRPDHKALLLRRMSSLFDFAGSLIDRIKINVLTREIRGGRVVWTKRRRASAGPVMTLANRFFALVGNPVHALADVTAWQMWEVACFGGLHGDDFRAACGDGRSVHSDELPGVSLSAHLEAGTLTPDMLRAAGRELQRAHAWKCSDFDDVWSHGDPHTGNFIYDAEMDRARLIDFEVQHHRGMSAHERHADDLLICLQDLMGRVRAEDWLSCATAFLAGYGRPEIHAALAPRLVMPRGLARLWWSVRTTYLSRSELQRRLQELQTSLVASAPRRQL